MNIVPITGNAAAAANARTIITDPALCARRPALARLAWIILHSAKGKPAIQSRLPRGAS
ncbi:MAG TPA: hypothetical protein GX700_07670 [Paracoccus sp.]|nr:hypothetical protein [Paracoccus sp. (in: a-proteobacteria)]